MRCLKFFPSKALPGTLLAGLMAAMVAQSLPLQAEDWSQWRGPTRNGVCAEEAWQKSWPKLKLKSLWSKNLGIGYSAVSTKGDRVYTLGYRDGQDTVYCLKAQSGEKLWSFSYRAKNYNMMNAGGPSGTPSIYKGKVYTISRQAQLHCLDAKTGRSLWAIDFRKSNKARVPIWGFSGSPLIVDKVLYIDVGCIVALNPENGEQIWATKNYGSGYSSPVAFQREGKDYLAVFPARGLVILDRKSGREITQERWRTNYNVNAATPLIFNKGQSIFVSSGYNVGGALYEFDGQSLKQRWFNKGMRNQMASSVHYKGFIYGFDETQLKCLDVNTGKVQWKQRGLGKGSLILSQGKLIVLSDRGELLVAEASDKGFKPQYKKSLLDGRGCWTAPVLSDNRIYLRNPKGQVMALQVVGQETSAPKTQPKNQPQEQPKSGPKKKKKFF